LFVVTVVVVVVVIDVVVVVLQLGMLSPNTQVFLQVYDYEEKADLSKTYWNIKRKM